MPFKKIEEPDKWNPGPEPCWHPEHNPPMHIVLEPGTYAYTCPGCGNTITLVIPPRPYLSTL
jgi:hypothetical protein